ncbi:MULTISPECIES: diaminopropionate ammonia-lyase [Arthrobacter]|uniref:Diaminopropionate ammonia-lyase n=1 Tax=Arthrobacter terricola TaxID=2547396 RepID=A0A4R5KDT0_9MICC|nr:MULTISPECIES: diaminopropionate ammonia-lyase [Arthrobacter]MBT8161740.1 diaminopropionate ammonia-lyase [Arthrobacter sp. GN70]TDF92688.1 diaminopropionate ammonia-lyase [Arthrobacter terricola]
MPSTDTTSWYANPAARTWRTAAPSSALAYHQTLEGYAPTPLTPLPQLAAELGVGQVFLKNESDRLGLPAFKILGASCAVCRAICERFSLDASGITVPELRDYLTANVPAGQVPILVTATDGNHGRAVSRMARLLGLKARIYIPKGLSDAAIEGIKGEGAELIPLELTYDDVVQAAAESAEGNPLDLLVQDTSWPGYEDIPRWIVDGYTTLFTEIDQQLAVLGYDGPDLVACPVGVGSLAHSLVDHYRSNGHPHPSLLSVEPETAACIARSLLAGEPITVDTSFPTIMSGLNCGTPSELGWPSLLAGLDAAISVSEDECRQAVVDLNALGQDAGPCGAATLAGVRTALQGEGRRRDLNIGPESILVLVSTEGLDANPLR